MENEEDMIGQMFRTTFEEHTVPLETGEWEGLNTQLTKRNFFHFNAFQFNIYYASMLIFCFITCVFVGTHYTYSNFFKNKGISSNEGKVERNKVKGERGNKIINLIQTEEKLEVGDQNNPSFVAKGNPTKVPSRNQNRSLENDDFIQAKESELTTLDTATIKAINPVAAPVFSKSDSVKPKPKRIVYITKQDTIVQFDTIQAPKKKKKWFK